MVALVAPLQMAVVELVVHLPTVVAVLVAPLQMAVVELVVHPLMDAVEPANSFIGVIQ